MAAPAALVKHGEVVPDGKPARTRRPKVQPDQLDVFERLARDPQTSVEKIQGLMDLWERAERRKAETAFHQAMALAQGAMRPVAADANNSHTSSKYASYAALDRALRPIYTEHGFGLSFNTVPNDYKDPVITVQCDVSHVGGFVKKYSIDMPADGKGSRGGDVMTRTHATGSAVTYGMRYLLKMIFNVAIGQERDDDGNAAGRREPEPDAAPAGFDDWLADIGAAVEGGCTFQELQDAWAKSSEAFKRHASLNHRATVEAWKATAQKAGQS